jgi:hypothetical protein
MTEHNVGSAAAMILTVVVLFLGCGDNQDPVGARALWEDIQEQAYRGFSRAPGYERRRSSNAPHGEAVDIYVNEVVAGAIDAKARLSEWPAGSLIVKDGWDGDDLVYVTVMQKRADGWYWAEYVGEGDAVFSGRPDTCIDCHSGGEDYVRAFPLPGP